MTEEQQAFVNPRIDAMFTNAACKGMEARKKVVPVKHLRIKIKFPNTHEKCNVSWDNIPFPINAHADEHNYKRFPGLDEPLHPKD